MSKIRVDFFKQTGKWYTTEEFEVEGSSPSTHDFERFLTDKLTTELEGQRRIRYAGMNAVCLNWGDVPVSGTVPEQPIEKGRVLAHGFIIAVQRASNSYAEPASLDNHCEVSFGRHEFKLGLTDEQAKYIALMMENKSYANLEVKLVLG